MGYAARIIFAASILHLTGNDYALSFLATGALLLVAAVGCRVFVKEILHIPTVQRFVPGLTNCSHVSHFQARKDSW